MNLINWNIDRERKQYNEPPATGIDPYEPITDEDEGCNGFAITFTLIISTIVMLIDPLLSWRSNNA